MDYSEPLDLSLPAVKLKNSKHNFEADMPLDLSKKRTDNPHIIQTGPFTTTTNINNITNFGDKRSGIQTCESPTLTYINSTKPRNAHCCIPIRNKFSDNYEDDLESSEKPFDFSFRYSETKPSNSGQKIDHSNNTFKGKKSKSSSENFTNYAETDLDQPTDYSLRYAENDSDSDSEACDNAEKTTTAEFVGDTVKTYCTEGTPYETPFNFSTSTSMSDLRISDKNPVGGIEVQEEKTKIAECIPEDDINAQISNDKAADSEDHQPQTPKMKSEFNSGLTSPEKPMNYCEEGTPGYFSRVSSFGSLISAAAGSGEEKLSEQKHKCEDQNLTPKSDKMQQKLPASEVKVVKFENIVNYCEETPLMFSRSSSLGSLGSIEQHSIHDDRSSVISDFSRLTSGIISPSEIPDSPTQTVPPSPKQQKSSEFGIMNRNSSIENRRHPSARRSLATKSSIFEDNVTKFKEENTPAQFSVATSLSSLTIDDNDETQLQEEPKQNCGTEGSSEKNLEPNVDSHNAQDETNSFCERKDSMQNRCFSLPRSGQFPNHFQNSASAVYNPSSSTFPTGTLSPILSAENTTHIYNTEDTPAVLSHNGSISELSLSLSMLDEEPGVNRVYLSENSSQSSGGHRNILADKEQLEATSGRQEIQDVWVRRESVKNLDSTPFREVNNLPPFLASRDECSQFAVEDSPAQFSLRSSLSHLTIESETVPGIEEYLPKDTPDTSREIIDCSVEENTSEQNIEDSDDIETHEEHSVLESSAASISHQETEGSILNEEKNSVECDSCIKESVDASNENAKSYELKSDDSRCNSMKKRKWKWKWQFASEDGPQSESGESTPTDRRSCSNNEEFDQGRRNRVDKNNSGSLDASFRKKKWWKWKFGSKEKDSLETNHNNTQETNPNVLVDNDPTQKSNSVDEKESDLKEGTTVDTRNKSKRWKWKWKLNFKDDENSKQEKLSLGLSKLKHQVSPESAKEPICINELSQSADIPKEKVTAIKFSAEEHPKLRLEPESISREITHLKVSSDEVSKNTLQEHISVASRRKLDTPEPSDSEQSVIIEEVNEANLYENNGMPKNRNLSPMINEGSTNEAGNNGENVSGNNSSYAALVEECIQLGMPKKKNISDKPISHNDSLGLSSCKKGESDYKSEHKNEQSNILSQNTAVERIAILEECIQLGMRKKSRESILNEYVEDNVNSPKTNYKSVNQKGSTSFFTTNKSFDVISMKELKTQETRNTREESSAEKLMRAKSTNFDSSSLNRLSLGRVRKYEFNSNDNILKNIPNGTSGKMEQSNMKRSLCKEYYDGSNSDVNSSKITEQEMSNSQFKLESSSNRTARKTLDSKPISNKDDPCSQNQSENHSQMVPNNLSSQNKITTKSGCLPNSNKNPDFAALIEECIQLGMPKRKESSEETLSPTLSPSLVNKNPISFKGWPEYLSRIAGENKSASLPKKSSTYLTTPQDYCVQNEDFMVVDSQVKKNLVTRNSLQKNATNKMSPNNEFKSDVLKKKQEKIVYMPSKLRLDTSISLKEFVVPQNENQEESLYANADETRSYLSLVGGQQMSYNYKSPSSKRSLNSQYELSSRKEMSSDEENNAALIEDCVRLGVPVNKLQEMRRSFDRSNLQGPKKPKNVEEFVRSGTPKTIDSEDEAVYANTTERYSTFKNPPRIELKANRNGESPLSPKYYNDNSDDVHSIVMGDKKIVPCMIPNKNSKKNLVNDDHRKKSTKTDCSQNSKNNQDFAAIIEECIQLGMPKRKEFSRETLNSNLSLTSINSRSNSVTRCTEDLPKMSCEFNRSATLPRGSTYLSTPQNYYSSNEDFERTCSLKKKNLLTQYTPDLRKNLMQDQYQLNVSKKDPIEVAKTSQISSRILPQKNTSSVSSINNQPVERVSKIITDRIVCIEPENSHQEDEESLYVNVSKHAGYSRSTSRSNPLVDFVSSPPENAKTQVKSNSNKKDINSSEQNYSALVEECIKLGMPSKKINDVQKYLKNITPQVFPKQHLAEESDPGMDSEETTTYANTSERYSTFRSSIPESGLNRSSRIMKAPNFKSSASSIPVGGLENRKTVTTSPNIEKALEECIQLGWPKKKEIDKNHPVKTSNIPLHDTLMKKAEQSTSKNVNVASVARNMQNQHLACSKVPAMVTGARDDSELQSVSKTKSDKEETIIDMERNGFNRSSLNYLSLSNNQNFQSTDDNQQAESEISFAGLADIDVKLLDPQLMLESLEKYTAKLISEAEMRLISKNNEV